MRELFLLSGIIFVLSLPYLLDLVWTYFMEREQKRLEERRIRWREFADSLEEVR